MDTALNESKEWTVEDLRKLFAAMRDNIPHRCKMSSFLKVQRKLDWNKIAFDPHSSKACQKKWEQISLKIRKMRTLTELLDDVESTLDNPLEGKKVHPEYPKKPKPANAIFLEENWLILQHNHPGLSVAQLFELSNNAFKALPDERKASYTEKSELAAKEYKTRLQEFKEKYGNDEKGKSASLLRTDEGEHGSTARKRRRVPLWRRRAHLKPPANGYILFCNELLAFEKSPVGMKGSSYCAQQWQRLTDDEKSVYRARSAKLMQQHAEQKADSPEELQETEENALHTSLPAKRGKCSPDKEDKNAAKKPTSDSEDIVLSSSSNSSDEESFYYTSEVTKEEENEEDDRNTVIQGEQNDENSWCEPLTFE